MAWYSTQYPNNCPVLTLRFACSKMQVFLMWRLAQAMLSTFDCTLMFLLSVRVLR